MLKNAQFFFEIVDIFLQEHDMENSIISKKFV